MSNNPTLSAGNQFSAPFNILPDVIYTNPTSQGGTQFIGPFNTLPDLVFPNPTADAGTQFTAPFNILPDIIYINPTSIKNTQFVPSIYENWAPTTNATDQPPIAGALDGVSTTDFMAGIASGTFTSADFQFISKNSAWDLWQAPEASSTNVTAGGIGSKLLGSVILGAASGLGVPQVAQFGQAIVQTQFSTDRSLDIPQYSTLALDQLKPFPGVLYSDFRSRRILKNFGKDITGIRLDGASALLRGSFKAGAYAAATALPIGAYSVFNLNGAAKTGYGWGDHDNPYAIRNDFTARSHVAKRWDKDAKKNPSSANQSPGNWAPTRNPAELLMPFRGDRVSVIDFGQRSLAEAYLWNPNVFGAKGKFGAVMNKMGITQDFIKFYMTGPKIFNGAINDPEDDIIVFRASITSLSDTFNGNWTPITMVGRADPNYQYTGYGRDLSLDFTVYATDRDEMQPIWRKLNALAGYTAPTYTLDSIALKAPWMRITIGDLFVQTPVLLTSVSYTLHDTDTTWEINIEDDPTMMQAPHKVSVSCAFTVIGDDIPQKNGRFYTLAKDWDESGSAKLGPNNWLSDALGNSDLLSERQKRIKRNTGKGSFENEEVATVATVPTQAEAEQNASIGPIAG
jgi:hypothetical protein